MFTLTHYGLIGTKVEIIFRIAKYFSVCQRLSDSNAVCCKRYICLCKLSCRLIYLLQHLLRRLWKPKTTQNSFRYTVQYNILTFPLNPPLAKGDLVAEKFREIWPFLLRAATNKLRCFWIAKYFLAVSYWPLAVSLPLAIQNCST